LTLNRLAGSVKGCVLLPGAVGLYSHAQPTRDPLSFRPQAFPAGVLGGLLLASLFWISSAVAGFTGFDANGNGDNYPAESNGRKSDVPCAYAFGLDNEKVKLDGKLDEAVWKRAPGALGFYEADPDRGELPSEETVFKVLYDGDAIYFGVACLENDPKNILSNLSRRDRFNNFDLVSIYIDPYLDKTTGYNFKVNPLGVQMDSYVFNDGDMDQDWDAVWEAETFQDEHGWYAEVRIPFSAIRYRPADEMTWGLQVYRYMHGRGEDTAWVTWDRETRGFVSRFGELRGLRGVSAPRQLEVTPYFVTSATDPATSEPDDAVDRSATMGADVKYGVTADLTLNATIQPDFGQVEADPAVVNLSPFETFFEEKRPFFIEGARFFQHPDFNMFYSRRIGTGDENSRIRLAGKLTGKLGGGLSLAGLFATTDVTGSGQAHNFFKVGTQKSYYFVGRVGKEFSEGAHRFNAMQTAVVNTADRDTYGDRGSREAYTTGLDFDLNFHNRDYNIQGSWVGSVVNSEESLEDPALDYGKKYGTGGALDVRRLGGNLNAGIYGRWEHDKLDLNDVGFLSAPDEINTGGWLSYQYSPDGTSKMFNRGNFNFNLWRSWLYASRTGHDETTGDQVWSYGRGHPQRSGTNINGWMQFRNYWETYWGIEYIPEGIQRYETRGGPLIIEPTTYGGWLGGGTDYRKKLAFNLDLNYFRDTIGNYSAEVEFGPRWNQSSAISHELWFGYNHREDDTQWLENVDLTDRPGGQGIGGMSYVFGKINQETLELTLRTNVLFTRDQSLELYVQPFVSVADFTEARELETPGTYDLIAYNEPGYDVRKWDFVRTSVNLNAVYRWQYRPGSTLYLVWTYGAQSDESRGVDPEDSNILDPNFNNSLGSAGIFNHEPEHRLLLKVSYWLPI
jgi:hypothetical protein